MRLFKKKEKIEESESPSSSSLAAPEFRFIRSDTHTEEVIHPPSAPHGSDNSSPSIENDDARSYLSAHSSNDDGNGNGNGSNKGSRLSSMFGKGRSSRSASVSSNRSAVSTASKDHHRDSAGRRLSQRLHLSRSPASSENVPQDLPEIVLPKGAEDDAGAAESQWERRATILARVNEKHRSSSAPGSPGGGTTPRSPLSSGPASPIGGPPVGDFARMHMHVGDGSSDTERTSRDEGVSIGKEIDEDIQWAIELHEENKLEESTRIFARLADPHGANNPMSQIMYGLALRHGWGCTPDTAKAVDILSKAAANAAAIEQLALVGGRKQGGAAKGELVLAIFELANCFAHGWGVDKDPVAAKQYYETAANLGDIDAMNEVGRCYERGIGCKKDKFMAAQYYRKAETANKGNSTVSNSWIWKEKYDDPNDKGARKK